MQKRNKTALESGVLILIVAAILVAVNALSVLGVYARKDVTKAEKFTLSKGSGNLLRSMKQDLKVDAYVTKGLPKLDTFVRDLRDLLQEYKNAGGTKFDYTMIEAKDEETRKKAKDANLVEQPFGEASGTEDEKAAVTQGFMGLVFRYGEQQDVIKFLPPDRTDGLEFWITNKIREIRDKGDDIHHKIGVLTGHDEIKPSDNNLVPTNMGKFSIQGIITQNFPFYTFQDVDLKGGETEIPDELDGLIVTQPGKDLSEEVAAAHRPVRDEGQITGRLRQRRQHEGQRSEHERDDEYARSGEAPRRLRHRFEQGRGRRRVAPRALDGSDQRWRGRRRARTDHGSAGRHALHGQHAARRHELRGPVPGAGRGGAVRVQPDAQDGEAARHEDAGGHALVAVGGAPHGRVRRPEVAPEVGGQTEGSTAAAVRGRGQRRGDAEDRIPGGG